MLDSLLLALTVPLVLPAPFNWADNWTLAAPTVPVPLPAPFNWADNWTLAAPSVPLPLPAPFKWADNWGTDCAFAAEVPNTIVTQGI